MLRKLYIGKIEAAFVLDRLHHESVAEFSLLAANSGEIVTRSDAFVSNITSYTYGSKLKRRDFAVLPVVNVGYYGIPKKR